MPSAVAEIAVTIAHDRMINLLVTTEILGHCSRVKLLTVC